MWTEYPGGTAAALVVAKHRAFETRDWSGLKAVCHPDARCRTVMGGIKTLGSDEGMRTLRAAAEDPLYDVWPERVIPIDESAALLSGYVRTSKDDVGWRLWPCWWMYTMQDGLIFRAAWYRTWEGATGAYKRHGVELGLVAPQDVV